MAPVPESPGSAPSIRDLAISSLELDSRSTPFDLSKYLSTLSLADLKAFNRPPPSSYSSNLLVKRSANPSDALLPRDAAPPQSPVEAGSGAVPPSAINMKGIQALFALIGASFVLGGIWFFFWAKNGGFQWRKRDWDDYKTTVMRRKGADGKTLSNATKSTRLGGGSVVASGYSDDDGTIFTGMSSEAPIIKEKQGRGNKKGKKEKVGKGKGLRGGGGHGHVHNAASVMEEKVKTKFQHHKNDHNDNTNNKRTEKQRQQKQERWEGGFDDDMRAYRHEKPAKVGGLNRGSDTQYYGTDYSHSGTDPSTYGSGTYDNSNHNRNSPSNRRHSSTSPDKHPHQNRRSHRNSSYTNGHGSPQPQNRYHSPNKPPSMPSSATYNNSRAGMGTYVDPLDFDSASQGTKSYHHPIPGLSGTGAGFRASNAKANVGGGVGGTGRNGRGRGRGGGRRDSLDDSD